jgi:hypothetical protein
MAVIRNGAACDSIVANLKISDYDDDNGDAHDVDDDDDDYDIDDVDDGSGVALSSRSRIIDSSILFCPKNLSITSIRN